MTYRFDFIAARRFSRLCALAACWALAAAAPVQAASSLTIEGTDTIVYSADGGQANELEVAFDSDSLRVIVTDHNDHEIAPGGSCSQGATASVASCPTGQPGLEITRFRAALGDLDDTATFSGWTAAAPAATALDGGSGSDRLTAPAAPATVNRLAGADGYDMLIGGDGADTLDGGSGDDTLDGGAGDDILAGDGEPPAIGLPAAPYYAGDDLLVGGPGADTLAGNGATDTVSYAGSAAGVSATIDGVANDGADGEGDDIYSDVERLHGGTGDDTLTGDAGPNSLDGDAGNDTLNGGAGTAADSLIGGPGRDTVSYTGRADAITATLDATVNDGAGCRAGQSPCEQDAIFTDVENLTGGSGDDHLGGGDGAPPNVLTGGAGDDTLAVRDALADSVACGIGTADRVIADALDKVDADCETVDRGQAAISIAGASVAEGDGATVSSDLAVKLSEPSLVAVSVGFATADGTATAADGDYVPTSGTLTFSPGQTQKTVRITVRGDAVVEPTELFAVDLSKAHNAVLSSSGRRGTVTIVNDDEPTLAGPATAAAVPPAATIAKAGPTDKVDKTDTTDKADRTAPLLRLSKDSVALRKGAFGVRIGCGADSRGEPCSGSLRGSMRIGSRRFAYSGRFNVRPSSRTTIKVRISKQVRAALASSRRRSFKATAKASAVDRAGNSATKTAAFKVRL